MKWPRLITPKEVRQFLGLCGTVRIWIPNYSKLVRPLTELYHKDKEFIWGERQEQAFQMIKQLITSAPALRPINYKSERPIIVSVDSSQEAAGMILSQLDEQERKRPARYGSVPMSERESQYSQPKLELFGLYRALREWRIFIIGAKNLYVEVDAKYIKGMLNDPDLQPNAAINRWIQGILMFNFTLVHVPAERHQGPDALSRRPLATDEEAPSDDDSWLDAITLLAIPPRPGMAPYELPNPTPSKQPSNSLPMCLATRIVQDQMLHQIKHFLTTLESPVFDTPQRKRRFLAKATECFIKNESLYKRNGNRLPILIVLEPAKKLSILTQAHEKLGHRGVTAVYRLLRERFFWPHMHADVHHHVRSCHECQIRSLKRVEIPLTISKPTSLFSKIYIDIMHMPEINRFKYIVAAKDDLSGTSEAKALRSATSKELAKFFWEQIYCRYGAPQQVATDNGPEVKKAFQVLLERLGIPHIKITPYNHHANGVVERGHFTMREAIIKSCQGDLRKWPDKVQEAVFADRVTVSRVTGYSPYQLLHGTDPLLPLDLAEATFLVEGFEPGISTSELLVLRIHQLSKHPEDVARAAQVLQKARFASKLQFEQRFQRRMSRDTYKPGELVLVRNTAIEMSHDRKHQPRYLGPYIITEQTRGKAYKVQEVDGTNLRQKIGAFRLLPYIKRSHQFMKNNAEGTEIGSDSGNGNDSDSSGTD